MISALVLAAGLSTRMGQPKMLLRWGESTVIGKVVGMIMAGGVKDVVVVTGGTQDAVKAALQDYNVRFIYNQNYADGEMLTSVQVGLIELHEDTQAAMIVLGDQPQIEPEIIWHIIDRYVLTGSKLVVPSYNMHRGHPWLVERTLWGEISKLRNPATLQSFLNKHQSMIEYLVVDTPSVLHDLDTLADYEQNKPRG